jgi:hypothetical protein
VVLVALSDEDGDEDEVGDGDEDEDGERSATGVLWGL